MLTKYFKSLTHNNDKMNLNDSPCPMNLKEISLLSKPPTCIDDQDNMNSKDENKRMKPVTVKVNSLTSIRSKSNNGHLQSDQFGGQKKIKLTICETNIYGIFCQQKTRKMDTILKMSLCSHVTSHPRCSYVDLVVRSFKQNGDI